MTPGELLEGKYQILRELGRGAMGVVYEALHVALGRRIAIKTLIEGGGADSELGTRFQREARAASAIGHPHIIDVFDLGRTKEGLLFMVMELLDGSSLEGMLKKTPMLPLPLAIDIMTQVLSGLSAAHKNGIVHRDLKPDNIFVTNREERPNFVKIVDFGISKVLDSKTIGATAPGMFTGTMVGTVLGTPLYMSPEQAVGQITAIDHRTDIYSAGVVLYEMLCGCTPFAGKSYPEVLGKILEGKYRKPSEFRPDIPRGLETAIERALSRDIEARFPTAAAMRTEIAAGQSEITLTPAPVPLGGHGASVPPAPSAAPAPVDGEPIKLLDSALAPRPSGKRSARPSADPFAPPPESDAPPLLASDLERSIAFRPSPASRSDPQRFAPASSPDLMPASRRPSMAPRERAQSSAESEGQPRRSRARMIVAAGIVLALAAIPLAYRTFGPGGKMPLMPTLGGGQEITLVVQPAAATVQVDHIPVEPGLISLEGSSDRKHKLNAAAPGRLTRRFTFTAPREKTMTVWLSHALDLPSLNDPAPLPAELAADYPESPRSTSEIDAAFAKLAKYDDCLAEAATLTLDGKKTGGRGRSREDDLGVCRLVLAEAPESEPMFPQLQTAGEAFMAAQKSARPERLHRLAASFRAEFLAERTAWQVEELSRVEKDEGQKASWHMRRVALAAQAWLRSLKSSSSAQETVERQRAELVESFSMFTQFVRLTPDALAQTVGATDFMTAAEEVMALANGTGGRKATEFSALDACRKLLAAFNALVVE